MGFDTPFYNIFRIINRALPFRPHIIYVAPAKNTSMVAEECRAHLNASPALNAIKSILVAYVLACNCLLAVSAYLYCAMVPYKPIALIVSLFILQILLFLEYIKRNSHILE